MDGLAEFELIGEGLKTGVVTLTREKPLNSLTLETINLVSKQVFAWLDDDTVACIVLNSSTDRAFCAGADITALQGAIKAGDIAHADSFFTNEYRLDHALHTAAKPILVWGSGVVMGGGLGLLSGGSHRVGTPDNRIAMPEITIGLFPDAGGTWLLSHMPDHLGAFVGLTGCQLSAADGLALGVLDYVMAHEQKAGVIDAVASLPWSGDAEADRALLTTLLAAQEQIDDLPGNLLRFRTEITELMRASYAADDFFTCFEAGLDQLPEDDWIDAARQTYHTGAAVTARIFHEQLARAQGMSLADTFRLELLIACQCARHPDFPEGVRALLVDKDRSPRWSYRSTAEVPAAYVEAHFEPSWSGEHPLADL